MWPGSATCSTESASVRSYRHVSTTGSQSFQAKTAIASIRKPMKTNPALAASQNTNKAFETRLSARPSSLPPTYHRVIAGVEMHRDSSRENLASDFFGREVRHYRMTARHISAPAISLDPLAAAELVGAIRLLSEPSAVLITQGIPTPVHGTTFKVERRADLFPGGTLNTLEPGTYTAGDTVGCDRTRRIYLELKNGSTTSIAVVGVFMHGHPAASVDWRVTGRA